MSHSPEARLIITAEQAHLDQQILRDTLEQPLNWSSLIELTQFHQTYPRLYPQLEAQADLVPVNILARFQAMATTNQQRALRNSLLLVEVLQMFANENIVAIPFKGITLALAAYGNIGLRHAGDIDLILPKLNMPLAEQMLLQHGFIYTEAEHVRQRARTQFYHIGLRDLTGTRVELHWALTSQRWPFVIDHSLLFNRLSNLYLLNREIPAIVPEMLLLLLSIHGAKHFWTRLTWIADIVALICQNPSLDWASVFSDAEHIGCIRLLRISLLLANRVLCVPMPPDVLQYASRDRAAEELAVRFARDLFNPSRTMSTNEERRLMLQMRERLHDRAIVAYRAVVQPRTRDLLHINNKDREVIDLPPSLTGIYLLIRPFRLLRDWVKGDFSVD